MADHADEDYDGDIFIYRGGRAPRHITHARIDESVDEIEDHAFKDCWNLVQADAHDGIRKIGKLAFYNCARLRRINLNLVIEIDEYAFNGCNILESVEFGDRLETIGDCAFEDCHSLTHLNLPSIITVGTAAFRSTHLTDVELPERLETIRAGAFWNCRLRCIAIPLKRDLFNRSMQRYSQFDKCEQLRKVYLAGGIDKTVASLHMESWRTEMNEEINRINQVLPNTRANEKTEEIRQWMEIVLDKLDHYKVQHCRYVKEGITLLDLALWKAKLGEQEEYAEEGQQMKAKVDAECSRKDKRITCGADMVIKNVLPFLQLE
jgi:hypothetical protein